MNATARLYARYALGLLALTLLAGVHLRAAFAWPAMRGGMNGAYLIHAHSHAGFFGWAVMAAFAAITAGMALTPATTRVQQVIAHALGLASVAAFVGFALRGYDLVTVAISVLHVLLWIAFVASVAGRLAGGNHAARFTRAALGFLVAAGLATTAPVVMMVRGVTDPWLLQLGVKLFLTPFATGFLVLLALGIVYRRIPTPRYANAVLALIAAGTLPSTLLYVQAAPPTPWLTVVGRAGIALTGAGMLLFAADAARRRLVPLARVVIASAAATGAVQLLAAAGVGAAFMHSRAITIAVLHLVVLGVVTPALLLALRPHVVAPVRTAVYAAGTAVMLLALAATGWPWAARTLMLRGVEIGTLLAGAAVGGVVGAAALLSLSGDRRPIRVSADLDMGAPRTRV
ncbi:MAG TPA: hypothetical protein VK936_05490 [Longimicrobiales bacterium]|nr:hypothetical protein [Longimicrobiales bacterium]